MSNDPYEGFKKSNLSAEEVNNRIIRWSPSLDKLNKTGQTLGDYFQPLASWGRSGDYPQQAKALDLIHDRVDRLYGKDTADKLRTQMDQHPIGESGTHISFPRDRDSNNIVTFDNDLVLQGLMLSASLYRQANMPYHFGFYSSRVSIKNTNSAEYAQFTSGSYSPRTISSKKADSIVMFGDPIDAEKINDLRKDYTDHFFQKRIQRAKALLPDATSLAPGRLKSWQDFLGKELVYSQRNESTIQIIEEDLRANDIMLTDYNPDLEYANRLIDTLQSPLARAGASFGFPDQVMAVQTKLLNRILPQDIRQVTVDFSEISIKMMAAAFKDPNNIWYKTFADPKTRDAFVYNLADIRTGWGRDKANNMQSPFLTVSTSKGVSKPWKVDYETHKTSYAPEEIARNLENGKLIPTCALEVAFMLSETGIVPHGGMFQAIYAPDIQTKFSAYFKEHGELGRAQALENMPLDMATQSPCFGLMKDDNNGTEQLLRFSDFMKNPLSKAEADKIPHLKTTSAIGVASPTLHNFFTYYEPHLTSGVKELVSHHAARTIYSKFMSDDSLVVRTPVARSTGQVNKNTP